MLNIIILIIEFIITRLINSSLGMKKRRDILDIIRFEDKNTNQENWEE